MVTRTFKVEHYFLKKYFVSLLKKVQINVSVVTFQTKHLPSPKLKAIL